MKTRKVLRIGRRAEPRRRLLAYLVPVPGCVSAAWEPRVARVVDGGAELETALRALGCKAMRFAKMGEVDAWLDDERARCSICDEGRGAFRCGSCQEAVLLGQLERSVNDGRRVA